MGEKSKLQVKISIDTEWDMSENLQNYINSLEDALHDIPPKFRKVACISNEAEEDYGNYSVKTEIYYWRPFTERELKSKKEEETREKERVEIKEKQLLKRLTKKYQK